MLRLILLGMCLAASLFAGDEDRDGIDDDLEQVLLVRFLPQFIVSGGECDVAPAEFARDIANPKIVARNGTIYGQVLRHDADRLEVHYYHLWNRDCGARGHALDAEHVSALVRVPEQRAEFWYAAAHEDTLCNAGGAAKAATLSAEEGGPQVWISRGKHGSFFSEALCRRGCGGDRCEAGQPLAVAAVINIGELGAPMNGAVWTASNRWPLRSKMQMDFDDLLVTRIEATDGLIDLRGMRLPAQAAIAGGGRAVTEVDGARKRTEDAVSDAQDHTARALNKSTSNVEKALSGSKKSVADWLRRRL